MLDEALTVDRCHRAYLRPTRPEERFPAGAHGFRPAGDDEERLRIGREVFADAVLKLRSFRVRYLVYSVEEQHRLATLELGIDPVLGRLADLAGDEPRQIVGVGQMPSKQSRNRTRNGVR